MLFFNLIGQVRHFSEEYSLQQLDVLYRARGRRVEQLSQQLSSQAEEAERHICILRHEKVPLGNQIVFSPICTRVSCSIQYMTTAVLYLDMCYVVASYLSPHLQYGQSGDWKGWVWGSYVAGPPKSIHVQKGRMLLWLLLCPHLSILP